MLGIHDLNSEFYVTPTSGLFLNASLGVGRDLSQTAVLGPSIFPYAAAALRLKYESAAGFYVQTAIFNASAGDPEHLTHSDFSHRHGDGFLVINEAGYVGEAPQPQKFAVGQWSYTRTFDRVDTGGKAKSSGVYLLADHTFSEHLSAFCRFGVSTTQTNEIKNNLSIGAVTTGLLSSRPEDQLGLAATQVEASHGDVPKETAYELSYRFEVGHGIAVQPDFQFVQNPSFSDTVKDASIVSLRVEIGI